MSETEDGLRHHASAEGMVEPLRPPGTDAGRAELFYGVHHYPCHFTTGGPCTCETLSRILAIETPEQQEPTTEAVTEAWRAWRDAHNGDFPEPGRGEAFRAGWETRAAAPPDIDAERLVEALRNVNMHHPRDWAKVIAAEYRRLFSPDATRREPG